MAHTPARLLAARLRLLVKRQALVAAARLLPLARRPDKRHGPRLRDDLPPPIFPQGPRTSDTTARFLNLEVAVVPPVDWNPSSFNSGLQRLTLHYMEWLEGFSDEAFTRVLADWIARVRPYGPDYWNGAWNSYAVSIRCVVWMQQLALRRPRLAPETVDALVRSVVEQIRFLCGNIEDDIRGNHIIRNIRALLWAARCFEGKEADSWRLLGERLLRRELPVQVLPDGVHFERSPAYHAQVLADLTECAAVLPEGASRTSLLPTIDAMAGALAALTHPDGRIALFNDGGLHMSLEPASIGEALRGVGARPGTRAQAIALPSGGFYGATSGADYVLLKAGRIGDDGLPAHAHGDVGSFEWTLEGQRLIVDAGVFEYLPGPMRAWSRATASHNTVTVADADQAEFWSAFRVGRRPDVEAAYHPSSSGFTVVVAHDGFKRLRGAPRHTRRFEATGSRLDVEDTVEGGAGQPVRARLLLHPGTTLEPESGGLLLACGRARAQLTTSAAYRVVPAWWCPDFGVKLETEQIVIEYGLAPCVGSFQFKKLS